MGFRRAAGVSAVPLHVRRKQVQSSRRCRENGTYGGLPSAGRGGSARDHACASVDRWMADLAVCGPQMVVGRFVYLYVLWVETICIPRAKGCGPPAGRI